MRARLLAAALSLATPAMADPVPVVTVHITFDPAAAKALVDRGEWFIVSTYFSGDPAPDSTLPEDEVGQVYLGAETVTLWPADQTVTLGSSLAAAPLSQSLAPNLNVNVFSARFSGQDNLLDCGIVDGPMADMAAAVQEIHCSLL